MCSGFTNLSSDSQAWGLIAVLYLLLIIERSLILLQGGPVGGILKAILMFLCCDL